jgi:hypothetical protein
MSPKTILISAPLALGGLVLLWAAWAARSEPEAKPSLAAPKAAAGRKPAPAQAPAAPETSVAAPFVAPASAHASSGGGENALIEERIRKMEERLLALEAKKGTLSTSNQDLERQLSEKYADASARMMADWRVRSLGPLLGLSETQKQSLLDLWTKWNREDGGKAASRDTWLSREESFRSVLTAEQAAKQHESAVQASQAQWNTLGRTIGSYVGASKDDQTRFQQTLGEFRATTTMLMPEGYGADWSGMMREGIGRLGSLLSQDQQARLNQMVPR